MRKNITIFLVVLFAGMIVCSNESFGADKIATKKLTITSDNDLNWHKQENYYIANGNAIIDLEGSFKASADRIKYSYLENVQDMSVIELTGNSDILFYKNDTNYDIESDKITIDIPKEQYLLHGKGKKFIGLEDYSLTAEEEIKVDDEQKELKLTKNSNVKDIKGNIDIYADNVIINYLGNFSEKLEFESMAASGAVIFEKENLLIGSEYINFLTTAEKNNQSFYFKNNVQAISSDAKVIADEIAINGLNNNITYRGKVSLMVRE